MSSNKFNCRCIDCDCLDHNKMLYHPNDSDCKNEYHIDFSDLESYQRCDFYKHKMDNGVKSK